MAKSNNYIPDKRGRVVDAASDGACSGNPGPGGWGALIRFEDGSVEEFGGYEQTTTNNRMELQAVLAILQRLKSLNCHPNLNIRTDSKYVINGLSTWIKGWKRNGWRTASGKPVLNQDLWQLLDVARIANVNLEYVKGHSGDPDNERVDEIAVSYSKGTYIKLNSFQSPYSPELSQSPSQEETEKLNQPAPVKLQKLISRLDIANHIAKHGYSLNIDELAELLEVAPIELKQKKDSWQWRDWLIEPVDDSKWKLNFSHHKPDCFEDHQDD